MAGCLNEVTLIGYLGRDPEIRYTQDNTKVANLSVATTDSWKDRNTGERREKTEWHRVIIFDANIADIAEKYLKKGSKVWMRGSLQTRKWQAQDGQNRYTTEVVLQRFQGKLIFLGDSGSSGGGGQGYEGSADHGSQDGGTPPGGDLDDEIPF